jgi:hypothetical protein
MKKSYTIILATVLFLQAKTQIYTQYFEGTGNTLSVSISTSSANVWQIGKPHKTIFSSASSTPNVIVTDTVNKYPPNNVSTFTLQNNNIYHSMISLQWKQKLDFDQGKDGGIVEFSLDGGTTWENAHNNPAVHQFYGFQPGNKDTLPNNEYAFSGTDTTWRDVWLCIAFSNSIHFRFIIKSDSVNTNREGWMIDNFVLHQTWIHPIKEIDGLGNLVVYPNTSSGMVNVEMKQTEQARRIDNISLFSQDGKLLEDYGPNYAKVVLDISKYPEGNYYLKITIGKKTTLHKVIHDKD